MAGEFFREASVLVFVLSPLESLVSSGRLTWAAVVATLLVGGACAAVGFWLGVGSE